MSEGQLMCPTSNGGCGLSDEFSVTIVANVAHVDCSCGYRMTLPIDRSVTLEQYTGPLDLRAPNRGMRMGGSARVRGHSSGGTEAPRASCRGQWRPTPCRSRRESIFSHLK